MLKKHIKELLARAGRRMPVAALRLELKVTTGKEIGEVELETALTELVASALVVMDRDPDTKDLRVALT